MTVRQADDRPRNCAAETVEHRRRRILDSMVDDCEHDFETLAARVLPEHMQRLKTAMGDPMPMAGFASPGVGVRSLLKQYGHENDFSGCYVLVDEHAIYVGISRKVFTRLRQHVTGGTHFDASLAYRMAEKESPHGKTRSAAMESPAFRAVFEAKRASIRALRAAAITMANPVELYLFEVYAALTFRTSKWNTFRTH
jgi:hypothetical protein